MTRLRRRRLPALLDKRRADARYLRRLRSVSARPPRCPTDRIVTVDHAWLPRATCDASCVRAGSDARAAIVVAIRTRYAYDGAALGRRFRRSRFPCPGAHTPTGLLSAVLRCLGVRITVSGGPIQTSRRAGCQWQRVTVIFAIGAVMPGRLSPTPTLYWPGMGILARLMKVIPIDRASLRPAPRRGGTIAERLRAGHTVVAFPEGTTWCGLAYGPFRPAMFQAAVDAGRPVQPLRLTYHHRDGRPSTVPAYIGDDTLFASIGRWSPRSGRSARAGPALQLPATDRRDLAARCEAAVRGEDSRRAHGHALVV